ncbi:hypothetical protein C8R45DRAFT_920251 [Mycena sanguinolenta]|nr:hypothetical protein C8R45DRAFT_920251 [Mycena sanguinolenta]
MTQIATRPKTQRRLQRGTRGSTGDDAASSVSHVHVEADVILVDKVDELVLRVVQAMAEGAEGRWGQRKRRVILSINQQSRNRTCLRSLKDFKHFLAFSAELVLADYSVLPVRGRRQSELSDAMPWICRAIGAASDYGAISLSYGGDWDSVNLAYGNGPFKLRFWTFQPATLEAPVKRPPPPSALHYFSAIHSALVLKSSLTSLTEVLGRALVIS